MAASHMLSARRFAHAALFDVVSEFQLDGVRDAFTPKYMIGSMERTRKGTPRWAFSNCSLSLVPK
jgi:hypothetical protein